MGKPKIACIVGTRPDAIKSAPVVRELRRFSDQVDTVLISTGQHREMLTQALDAFDLKADHDLDIMTLGQSLAQVTTRALEGIDRILDEIQPAWVVAQGDTTTTFVAALAAFYRRIPFAHVEAGLRTASIHEPFPEEFNRRAVAQLSTLHFAPTERSAKNLLLTHTDPETIFVTGNTGIDAVEYVAKKVQDTPFADHPGRVVLVTTHRRENWGEPQQRIAETCLKLVEEFPDILLVVAMHKNPLVRATLKEVLDGKDRVRLIEPPDYAPFVKLMQRSSLILSDSGGVQEEAPSFGIPVLVLRDSTERPEGVEAGVAKLVGTNPEMILGTARPLLQNVDAYRSMAQARSPYGDGRASERIRYQLLKRLGVESPVESLWT